MKSNVAVNPVKFLQIARRLLSIIGAILGITGVIMLVRYYQQELAAVLEVLNQYLRNFKAIIRVASDPSISSGESQDMARGELSPNRDISDSATSGYRPSQETIGSSGSLEPESDSLGNRIIGVPMDNRTSDLVLSRNTPSASITEEEKQGPNSQQFINRLQHNEAIRLMAAQFRGGIIADRLRSLDPLSPSTGDNKSNIFVVPISKNEGGGTRYPEFAFYSTNPQYIMPSTSATSTSSVEIEQIISPPQSRSGSSELPDDQLKRKTSSFEHDERHDEQHDEQHNASSTEQAEAKTTDSSSGSQLKTPGNLSSPSDTIHSASNLPITFFADLPPKSPDYYKTGETKRSHKRSQSDSKAQDNSQSGIPPGNLDESGATHFHKRSASASSNPDKWRHRRNLSIDMSKIDFSDLKDAQPLNEASESEAKPGSKSKSKKDKHSPKRS